ncbi:MAG TPA: amidohydrolase family protein [Afipia sp.]
MSEAPAGIPPVCPGPPSHQHGPTRFKVPRGAVDTHCHVIGGSNEFVPGRSYTPPPAPARDYIAMLDATGMSYGVLTQVSVHGTNNRLMVETLRAHPRRLRGIAVIAPDCAEKERIALKESGVVGLRMNVLYSGGGLNLDQIETYGAICREMGWHLQFLLDARDLVTLGPRLKKLPVPFLVDHMGHFPTSAGVDHPGFKILLSLVRDGAWVRLSGAYRDTVDGFPYHDTIAFARALVEAAPDRCVWGSDWPHVANWHHMPGVSDLLDLLADWVPDEKLRDRILADNPQRLFGFPALA